MFISFVKSSKMEPAQLLDIVQKMKKLEQDDIDRYLLKIQADFYAAAKKFPQLYVTPCENPVHWLVKNVMRVILDYYLMEPLNKMLNRCRQIQS